MHKKEDQDGSQKWINRINTLLHGKKLVPTPFSFNLSTSGGATFVGSREFILQETLKAEKQFLEMSQDPSKINAWVLEQSRYQVQFYLRPGGLISKVPEDERPTEQEVLTWVPIIEDIEVLQGSTRIVLHDDSEE